METFKEGASREKRFTGIAGNGKEAAASIHRCSTGLTCCTGDRRGGIRFLHYKWAWNTDQGPSFIYKGRQSATVAPTLLLITRRNNVELRRSLRRPIELTNFLPYALTPKLNASHANRKLKDVLLKQRSFQTRRSLELRNLKSIETLARSFQRNVPKFPDRCFSSGNKWKNVSRLRIVG